MKEHHETLYDFHKVETEQHANEWLFCYQRIIGHWLGVLASIKADTKAVLNILLNCK